MTPFTSLYEPPCGPRPYKPTPSSPPTAPSSHMSFFFNDPPPTEIYTLSLHDALPIYNRDGTFREVSHEMFDHLSKFGMGSDKIGKHTSELQSHVNLVCRLLLEKKKEESFGEFLADGGAEGESVGGDERDRVDGTTQTR